MPTVLGMEATKHKKWKYNSKERRRQYMPSVGDDLEVVEGDKVAKTEPEENRRRRTLILQRNTQSWGFTLQSYGIHHKSSGQVELLTYVDYVEHGGPACLAGLRPGDVILSINGVTVEEADHTALVTFIKNCQHSMRMVVLFEDCCRKVEHHLRYMRLKRVLAEKIFELRSLEMQEKRIMAGMSRFDSCRSSINSSLSSLSSAWDDRRSLRPEMDVCPESLHCWNPSILSTDSSIDSTSIRSLSSPYLGPRFDFDHGSLPVSARLKPHLVQSMSFQGPSHDRVSVRRSLSTHNDRTCRSMFVESPSWTDFIEPIPEGSTSSPLARPRSIPDKLDPELVEMDLYRMSLGNSMRQRHKSQNSSLELPRTESSSLPQCLPDSVIEVGAALMPDAISPKPKMPSKSKKHSRLNKSKSPSGSANHSPVHSASPSPVPTSSNDKFPYSTDSSSINQDDSHIDLSSEGACWSPRSVGSSIFYIEEPDYLCDSPEVSSPISLADSSTSRFSYSDLPQIELKFINDSDEITHL